MSEDGIKSAAGTLSWGIFAGLVTAAFIVGGGNPEKRCSPPAVSDASASADYVTRDGCGCPVGFALGAEDGVAICRESRD